MKNNPIMGGAIFKEQLMNCYRILYTTRFDLYFRILR